MINSFAGAKASSCKSANQRRQSARRWGKVIKGRVTQSTPRDTSGGVAIPRIFWTRAPQNGTYGLRLRSRRMVPLRDDDEQKDSNLKTDTGWVILSRVHRLCYGSWFYFFRETSPVTATPGTHLNWYLVCCSSKKAPAFYLKTRFMFRKEHIAIANYGSLLKTTLLSCVIFWNAA